MGFASEKEKKANAQDGVDDTMNIQQYKNDNILWRFIVENRQKGIHFKKVWQVLIWVA